MTVSGMDVSYHKVKHARCGRCGIEEGVKYKDRNAKICRKCFTSEGLLVNMYLVPTGYIDHDAIATVEEDYKDWVEKDSEYEQEKLP
jgi:hypothetical protein